MLQYKELSVKNIWPLVKEIDDLMMFFPDYNNNQLPCRTHLYDLLATLRYKEVLAMIKNVRNNRAQENQDDKKELVHISKHLYEEIFGVMSQKISKLSLRYWLSWKGKYCIFVKEISKISDIKKETQRISSFF